NFLNNPGLQTHQINSIALDPTDSSHILVASQGNGIALTENLGERWDTGGLLDDGFEVEFSPPGTAIAYKMTPNGRLYHSGDGGDTWELVRIPRAGITSQFPVDTKIAIDPFDFKHLVVGGIGKIWESFDEGGTWRSEVRSPGKGITSIAFTQNRLP